MSAHTPITEPRIDFRLAEALLADQHPDLSHLPLSPLGSGWDNELFRIGSEFTLRLPRHANAERLLMNELRWLPVLAPRLPLAVPMPVRRGAPALGYPWIFSVHRYLKGETAMTRAPRDTFAAAEALGGFLATLHRPAPDDAPYNPFRSVPLSARAELVVKHLGQLREELGAIAHDHLLALWDRLSASEPLSSAPCLLHGDLHPANLIVHQGELCGVLDFGDVCAGDPATDLAVAFMLLPEPAHPVLFRAAQHGNDEALWHRARGWALALGAAAAAGSIDDPQIHTMGLRTLQNVLAQP